METKKYLYVVGSSYLVPLMLTLIVLIGDIYCLVTDWERFFSVNSMQIVMLHISTTLLVSLLPESNFIVTDCRNIFVYSINEALMSRFSKENLDMLLKKKLGIYGKNAISRLSSCPRSPVLRSVFLSLVSVSVLLEGIVGVQSLIVGVGRKDELLLIGLILLCVLDLCYIANRLLDRTGLRYLFSAFSLKRMTVVVTEVGNQQIVAKKRKAFLAFSFSWCMVYVGVMCL